MKYWLLLCTLSVLVHFSMQGVKLENCPSNVYVLGETMDDCMLMRCNKDGSKKVEMKSCDVITCDPGKQKGYHEGNEFADYPDCCSYPICEE